MDRLEYENYEEFICEIADKFDSLEDEFGDISIIAKYEEAKEIIKELLCNGYDVASIDIHREEFEEYYDEYLITLNYDGIWCEKFKRETGYFNNETNVTYVMDNCSSVIFKHIDSGEIYEVFVDVDEETNDDDINNYEEDSESEEHTYMVNGEYVDRETFDEYVSKFAPDLVTKDNNKNDGYSVTVKVGLDTEEAKNIIRDMNKNLNRHISDIFDMLYRPYLHSDRYTHPHPLRFFW